MSVVRFSCPQLLNATLRTTQTPVDQESVCVSANLCRDPRRQSYQSGRQRLTETEDPLQARKSDLYLLPHSTPPLGWLGYQKDVHLSQGLPQLLASVGQVSQESPCHCVAQSRLVDEFLRQADIGDVGRGELVGDRNSIG